MSAEQRIVIGIDGGGTRARALVAARDGRELARVIGEAGLVQPGDPGSAAAAVAQLARDALTAAGAAAPAAALCCGLAGAGREQEREAVRVALTLAGVAERVLVVGDAEAAMSDAFGDGTGILLIAGTGSIAWGRGPGGRIARVGGWGQLLGDEGSGYAIGNAALRAVARAEDGRDPATALRDVVLRHTGCREPAALVAWAAAATKADVAALAPLVLARAGDDAAARAIRDEALHELLVMIRTTRDAAGLTNPTVALHGGLVASGGPLRPSLEQALAGTPVLPRDVDGAAGAVRLALK